MLYLMSFVLSFSLGWNFLTPEDPNFINDYMRCYFSPTCNPILYDRFVRLWELSQGTELDEPNLPPPPPAPEPNLPPPPPQQPCCYPRA